MKKPAVFLDADVIFAGAAAPTEHGASHVVLRLGEITLIECVTSTQAIAEIERNRCMSMKEESRHHNHLIASSEAWFAGLLVLPLDGNLEHSLSFP